MQKERIFHYIKQAVDKLVEQNKFDTGDEFRLTQREALRAYAQDLTDEKLTLDEKLTGFFEIPTGIGKTALFLSIIGNAYRAAKANDEEFKAAVVVPLTTLLNDTRDEDAKRFIPDLMHEIGLYGDRHHTLGKPITLLTYPAFDTLTKEGKIGPHNIDLLITDESHRGTSENLTDNVIKIYEEAHTAMLGFTASAEFDDEKSVYNTHKRKIYSKKIGQAVKEGDQLTEYIQTQNFVIRVAPKDEEELKDIFGDAVADSDYQTRMKQAAWNKAMVQHLRDGRDERTKDPLTDNQGAFYTQDTTHANALGKALNQDPVLQQRAAAQGYKGVAAVVHTNGIPEKERKRLIKEYKAGKYMTLVGDSMFKEGFNHPPMKTVFDYMRGSLVDKVQVLGRGARRWWNEKKERYEGLTFIDSIVYVGSDDPEEDALYEARARRHAVLASKVMDGEAYALSPKEQEKEKRLHASGKLGGRAKVIFPDDDNIKEYVDLEDLQTFAREQEEFEKDRFEGYEPISEEDFLFLQSEAERTGLGGEAVFAKIDTPPKGMSKKRVKRIISGLTKSSPPEFIEALKKAYSKQPDTKYKAISEEDFAFLQAEAKRTGLGGCAIFNKINNPPKGLDKRHLKGIFDGTIKNTIPKWLLTVKETFLKQPDMKPTLEYKAISEEDFAFLQAEAKRTGLGGYAVFQYIDNPPLGMKSQHAGNIVYGKLKSAPQEWIDALKEVYLEQPNKEIEFKRVRLSEEDLAFLKSESERTGLGGNAIFRLIKNPPKGMKDNLNHINKLVKGKKTKSSHLAWVNALKEVYPEQPDALDETISEEDLVFLQAEAERTGLSGYAVFQYIDNPPKGMSKAIAANIVSGIKKFSPQAYIKALKDTYALQPNKHPSNNNTPPPNDLTM